MSVHTRVGLLPALLLIFLGPPTAMAVRDGWFQMWAGMIGGVCVLAAAAWIGYARSTATLIRHRHAAA